MKNLTFVAFASLFSTSVMALDKSYLVVDPVHPGSGMPFSISSSLTGICKALGYERGAADSMKKAGYQYDAITVNEAGRVTGGYCAEYIKQLVCVNRVPNYIHDEQSVSFTDMKHPDSGLPFSIKSAERGVCRVLGADTAVPGSGRGAGYNYYSIQVDERGSVVSGPFGNYLKSIVCLKYPRL